MLSYGFRYFETQKLFDKEVALKDHEIYYAEAETVGLGVADDVVLTFPCGYYKDIEVSLEVPKQLEAPLAKGDEVGELLMTLGDEVLYRAPLITLEEVPEAGMFGRMGDFVSLFFANLFGGDD